MFLLISATTGSAHRRFLLIICRRKEGWEGGDERKHWKAGVSKIRRTSCVREAVAKPCVPQNSLLACELRRSRGGGWPSVGDTERVT